MAFLVRYPHGVDERLKVEMVLYARWLRGWCSFDVPLQMRLVGLDTITDYDGETCHLR